MNWHRTGIAVEDLSLDLYRFICRHMTQSKIMDTNLSQSVSKILTAYWSKKTYFFAWRPESCDAQLSNDVLKGSYWPSKSTDFEILSPLQKIRGVAKKQHSVNNDRTDLKRIGLVVHPMGHPSYSCRVRKCIFDRVLFFCNASFSN